MSPVGTFEKCRLAVKLSAYGGRPEVSGAQSTGAIDDALIIALACDDLTIALGLLRSCLASVKP
jgi:hypothetical protein